MEKNKKQTIHRTHITLSLYLLTALAQAAPDTIPIQKIRVALEKHEQSLRNIRTQYTVHTLNQKQDSLEYLQTGIWLQKNHHQYYTIQKPDQTTTWIHYDHGLEYQKQADIWRTRRITNLTPANLGQRLYNQRLSTYIKPEWAQLKHQTDTINGHPAWVVTIRSPHYQGYQSPAQIWIDQKRGIPLQIIVYNVNEQKGPLSTPEKAIGDLIYHNHEGHTWVPIQGDIIQEPFAKQGHRIQIDPLSIQTNAEAIPDTLFTTSLTPQNPISRSLLPRIYNRTNKNTPPFYPYPIWQKKRSSETIELLAVLRDLAQINNEALKQVQLKWKLHILHETENPTTYYQPITIPSEADPQGNPYVWETGYYTNLGSDHYLRIDHSTKTTGWAQGTISQWDNDILLQADRPDLDTGVIDSAQHAPWNNIAPYSWLLRPFNGTCTLMELWQPEYAIIHNQPQTINGWTTYLIDVRHPRDIKRYARFWVDPESGLPLNIDYYEVTRANRLIPTETISNVELQMLPTGSWLPIEARRQQNQPLKEDSYQRVSFMQIETSTLTTDPNLFTEDLYNAPFVDGAWVYNTFTDSFERYQADIEEEQDAPKPPPIRKSRSKRRKRGNILAAAPSSPNNVDTNSPAEIDAIAEEPNTHPIQEAQALTTEPNNLQQSKPTTAHPPLKAPQTRRMNWVMIGLWTILPALGLLGLGRLWGPFTKRSKMKQSAPKRIYQEP